MASWYSLLATWDMFFLCTFSTDGCLVGWMKNPWKNMAENLMYVIIINLKKRHHHFIIISDMSLGIIIIIIIPKDCEEIFETCWNHQPLTFRLKQSHSIHRIHLEVHQKFHCSDPAQAPCQRKSAGRCGQWICPRLSAFADRTPHTARHNKQTPSYQ